MNPAWPSSLIQRALKTLDRHLHEPGVAFTSTRAAREWLILNMAGLEREEFRVPWTAIFMNPAWPSPPPVRHENG